MFSELAFVVGLGTSGIQTDWGTQGSINMEIPVVTLATEYKDWELKFTYGNKSTKDVAFNGWYQEEAYITGFTDVSLLRNIKVTSKLHLKLGYGYSSYIDHGKPLDSLGWKERDDAWGYRAGLTYEVLDNLEVNLSYSYIDKNYKHKERMKGPSKTQAFTLTFTKRF